MSATCDVGDRAPDFELASDGDKTVRLKDFRGKKLVLYFYPKDDTSGCTAEAIAFNGLKKEFTKAGAAILGVSPDPVKAHVKFKAKHDLSLELASDETKDMLTAYGVWLEKSMYGRKYIRTALRHVRMGYSVVASGIRDALDPAGISTLQVGHFAPNV